MGVRGGCSPGPDVSGSSTARDFPVSRPSNTASRMQLFGVLSSFLLLISTILASPVSTRGRRSDGYNDVGGVYDTGAAQDYWAARFGGGFFASLRALNLGGEQP